MEQSDFIKKRYSKWALIYDLVLDKIFLFNRKKVIEHLELSHGDEVIEIGVGTGLNARYYPKHIYVIGVDFSEEMLKKARKKNYKNVFFSYSDARNLPYKENSFNKALATFVLRVTPDPKEVLKELSRVVSNDGLLVIYDSIYDGSTNSNTFNKFSNNLGFGTDIDLNEEIKDTSWELIDKIQIRKTNTHIMILKNMKQILMEYKYAN